MGWDGEWKKGKDGKEKEDLHPTQFFGPDYSGLPSYGSSCMAATDVVIYFRFG